MQRSQSYRCDLHDRCFGEFLSMFGDDTVNMNDYVDRNGFEMRNPRNARQSLDLI